MYMCIIILSTQIDLGKRRVDESEGRLWAETKGFHYFETSALSGSNVQEMFESLIHSVVKVATEGAKASGIRFELGYTPEQAALVTRVRACHDNYQLLGVSRASSRWVQVDNHYALSFGIRTT